MNLPGCLIEVVQFDDGAESFVELGLAALARTRAGVPPDETDAADQARHADVLSQLLFRTPA